MHGLIFSKLKQYAETRHGAPAWAAILKEAGLNGKMYLPIAEYPDLEAAALVGAASRVSGRAAGSILEDFGEFLAPDLLKMYASLLKPEWKTLDVIEHTEETIHRVVRLKNPGARPPELKVSRPSPTEVLLTYNSARRMCGVAKGIARGLGKHFGESIAVTDKACMANGAAACVISIRREG